MERGKGESMWGKGKWGKGKRGKVERGRAREGWPAKIPSFIIRIQTYVTFFQERYLKTKLYSRVQVGRGIDAS